MREPFWLFKRRFKDGVVPLPIIKTYIPSPLAGLDYLHTTCRAVHTDLKLENIMLSFEDPAVLGDFMNSHLDQPIPYKIDSLGRHIYRSHHDFDPLRNAVSIPPFHYRAPEVILGCGWGTSVDIWNLGVLPWDLIHGRELFHHIHDARGNYQAKAHLAEMIALLGHPPPELVAGSHSMARCRWLESVGDEPGVACDNAEQYFGSPFFDHDGKFLHEALIPDRDVVDTLPLLEGEERENFLSLAKMMLNWLPEEGRRRGS